MRRVGGLQGQCCQFSFSPTDCANVSPVEKYCQRVDPQSLAGDLSSEELDQCSAGDFDERYKCVGEI